MFGSQLDLQDLLARFLPPADLPDAAERLEKLQEDLVVFFSASKLRIRFPYEVNFGVLAARSTKRLRARGFDEDTIRDLERHAADLQHQIKSLVAKSVEGAGWA